MKAVLLPWNCPSISGCKAVVNGRGHLVSRVLSDSGAANCYCKRMRPMMLLLPTFSSWWYVCTRVHACVRSLACFSLVSWCVLPRKSPEWGGGTVYLSSWQSQTYPDQVQCDLTDHHHSCVLHGAGRGVGLNHLTTIYFIFSRNFPAIFFFC